MKSELIMFAIDAGVRLGQKLNDVLVDATIEKPLLLPVGELFGSVDQDDAIDFFDDHPELTSPGQPYRGLRPQGKLLAYKTLKRIENQLAGSPDLDTGGVTGDAMQIVANLHAFRQYEEGFGAKPAVRRVIGTIVEIGIDYFVVHPEALGKKSSERKILQAFVESLNDVDFAEGTRDQIIGELLVLALETLQSDTSLIADSVRAQALIGGVTNALLADIHAPGTVGATIRREDFVRRIGSSVLQGGAEALSNNIDLLLPEDLNSKMLVSSTLTQLLEGIKRKEDLFTNESLEIIFESALQTVAGNAGIFADNDVLTKLIGSTIGSLTDVTGRKVFSKETVSAVLANAMEIAVENSEMLIDPDNPEKQLLANAVTAVAQGLSGSLAAGGTVKELLSRQQLVALTSMVFEEVAINPEHLLGEAVAGDRKAAVAQIIGSLTRALGSEPQRFVTGEGFVALAEIALHTATRNADKLLKLDTVNTRDNVLFQVVQQTVAAVVEAGDTRALVSREVFLELEERILPIVSANIDGLQNAPDSVAGAVRTALELAQGTLAGRINGENLPDLTAALLSQVLWEELDLEESSAVIRSATDLLKAA